MPDLIKKVKEYLIKAYMRNCQYSFIVPMELMFSSVSLKTELRNLKSFQEKKLKVLRVENIKLYNQKNCSSNINKSKDHNKKLFRWILLFYHR